MKQIRLLPVVIVAACALLLLKGVGIMTNGGYVLVGSSTAVAAGDGSDSDTPLTAEDALLTVPDQPTMTDDSPMLDDAAPTLSLGPAVEVDAGEPPLAEDAAAAAVEGSGDAAAGGEEEASATATAAPDDEVAAAEACPPMEAAAAEGTEAPAGGELAGLDFINPPADCMPEPEADEHADALPTMLDGEGNIVPLETVDGSTSENALLERLAERRDDLDTREAELEMRLALVEAAEKRIEERSATLEALEARINAMVDEKRTLEESQFVGVVAMYETMKAKDAAAIFDQLDLPVLLRVARAINPRKMAPIMAKMDPLIAKELTAGLAVDRVEPTIDLAEENLAALPQIIGQ